MSEDVHLVVQVCTINKDNFRSISEKELREIIKIDSLADRKDAFLNKSEPVSIFSDEEIDLILVIDGIEDADSWEELQSQLGP